MAILVESVGGLNLDAQAIRGLCGAMRRSDDLILEIPPDAESDWLAEKLRELSREGRFEQVLIEVAGTTNAARFPGVEPHRIICLVDALDFYHETVAPAWPDAFLDFRSAQIAAADLIVLNKCDLVGEPERTACVERLRPD